MDERELVNRVLRGDEKARVEFYRAYQQKLYSFCVYTLGTNDPEIEDILQEVFLVAFQKLAGFEFRSSLDTW
ncbi:MAG: RNA polymerase sigma factor, partial [bacterium]